MVAAGLDGAALGQGDLSNLLDSKNLAQARVLLYGRTPPGEIALEQLRELLWLDMRSFTAPAKSCWAELSTKLVHLTVHNQQVRCCIHLQTNCLRTTLHACSNTSTVPERGST